MYKIRLLLPLLVLSGVLPAWGQLNGNGTEHNATFSARRLQSRAARPAHVQTVKHGPEQEPALPDSSANPIPIALADRPQDTLLRRRKLRVRLRG